MAVDTIQGWLSIEPNLGFTFIWTSFMLKDTTFGIV